MDHNVSQCYYRGVLSKCNYLYKTDILLCDNSLKYLIIVAVYQLKVFFKEKNIVEVSFYQNCAILSYAKHIISIV